MTKDWEERIAIPADPGSMAPVRAKSVVRQTETPPRTSNLIRSYMSTLPFRRKGEVVAHPSVHHPVVIVRGLHLVDLLAELRQEARLCREGSDRNHTVEQFSESRAVVVS